MKRGTTSALKFKFDVDMTLVDSIVFAFNSSFKESVAPTLVKTYPTDGQLIDGYVYIFLSQSETLKFSKRFYVESQINFTDGSVVKTDIIQKIIKDTLFTSVIDGSISNKDSAESIGMEISDSIIINIGGGSTDLTNYYTKEETTTAIETSLTDYAKTEDIPTVPSKVSELENDADYAKTTDLPTVPTKTTDLENDAGYQSEADVLSCIENSETVKTVANLVYVSKNITFNIVNGVFVKNGLDVSESTYKSIDYTTAIVGENITCKGLSYSENYRQICLYNENKTYIRNVNTDDNLIVSGSAPNNTVSFDMPSDATYFRFSIAPTTTDETMIFYSTETNIENYVKKTEYKSELGQLSLNVKQTEENIKELIEIKIPLFVITFDLGGDRLFINTDTNVSRHDIVHGEYGLPYTSAVQIQASGTIDISSDNVKTLEKSGCDCCLYSSYNLPYTVHNNDSTVYTDENDTYYDEWYAYFKDAYDKAEEVGIYQPTTWCSRYNKYGVAMEKALKKLGFLMCRGNDVVSETTESARYTKDFNDSSFHMPTQTIQMNNLSKALTWIDNCIDNKYDFCFTTHELYSDEVTADSNYSLTPDGLRTLCAYLKDKQDKGLCKVVNMREYAKLRISKKAYENDYLRIIKKLNA